MPIWLIILLCSIGYIIMVCVTAVLTATVINIVNNDDRILFCWLWFIGIPALLCEKFLELPDVIYRKISK